MPRPLNGSPRHRRRTTTSIACRRSVPNDQPGTTTTPSTVRWRTVPPAKARITSRRSPTRSPARSNMTRITTREGRSQDPPEPRHVLRHHVCRLLELEPRERRWRDDVRGHVALLLARWLLLLVESSDEGPSRGRPPRDAGRGCWRRRVVPRFVDLPLHARNGRLLHRFGARLRNLVPRPRPRPRGVGDIRRDRRRSPRGPRLT